MNVSLYLEQLSHRSKLSYFWAKFMEVGHMNSLATGSSLVISGNYRSQNSDTVMATTRG